MSGSKYDWKTWAANVSISNSVFCAQTGTACWFWTGTQDGEYGIIYLDGKKVGAHRYTFFLANGYWPENACHTCDHGLCCRPSHLWDGTIAENLADMVAKGRSLKGERHNLANKTEEDIVAIRERYAAGETQVSLAAAFKTPQANISQIVRGNLWPHVGGPITIRWSRKEAA